MRVMFEFAVCVSRVGGWVIHDYPSSSLYTGDGLYNGIVLREVIGVYVHSRFCGTLNMFVMLKVRK